MSDSQLLTLSAVWCSAGTVGSSELVVPKLNNELNDAKELCKDERTAESAGDYLQVHRYEWPLSHATSHVIDF